MTVNGVSMGLLATSHMRGDGTLVHWDYEKGTNDGGNNDVVGTLGSREAGAGS